MLHEGIKKVDPNKKVTIIPREKEAIEYAITNAKDGSFIIICSDVIPDALAQVSQFKEEEANRLHAFSLSDIPNLK